MTELLSYIIESAACLLLFYLLYQLLLRRETFYSLNRVFLLFAVVFSMVVPLLNITLPESSGSVVAPLMLDPVTVTTGKAGAFRSPGTLFPACIAIIYFLMVTILLVKLFMNIYRIRQLNRHGTLEERQDYRLVIHQYCHPPFSFLKTIYISSEHLEEDNLEDIIQHEKAHARELHSVDVIISEVLIILFWFNPLSWAFRSLIKENHEFLADEAVLNRGFNPDAYQVRIISQLFGIRSMPAAHNFNYSIIQKRLKMIRKPKSPMQARLKFLLVLPAALAMFYMFACSTGDLKMAADETAQSESLVILAPDIPAEYPGGIDAFRKYITSNVRYPAEAREKGVEGKVFIQFIVDENGNIVTDVEQATPPPLAAPPPPPKSGTGNGEQPPPPSTTDIDGIVVVGYMPPEGLETSFAEEDLQLLYDEAIRVLKTVPGKWEPGKKDGKTVKTAWTFPVNFVLQ